MEVQKGSPTRSWWRHRHPQEYRPLDLALAIAWSSFLEDDEYLDAEDVASVKASMKPYITRLHFEIIRYIERYWDKEKICYSHSHPYSDYYAKNEATEELNRRITQVFDVHQLSYLEHEYDLETPGPYEALSYGIVLATETIQLYGYLMRAVANNEIVVSVSGHIKVEDVSEWFVGTGALPRFLAMQILTMRRYQSPPEEESSIFDRSETKAMCLIRKGREYWWGGLDPENEYRGKQPDVRAWFEKHGSDATDAAAFAKAIAPEWAKKGGRVYDKRKQVPKRDNSVTNRRTPS